MFGFSVETGSFGDFDEVRIVPGLVDFIGCASFAVEARFIDRVA